MSYGDTAYQFGPNGDLTEKRDSGGATTRYVCDSRGALMSVALPDGRRVEYVLDTLGRRVGRKVGGTLTHGWLYE